MTIEPSLMDALLGTIPGLRSLALALTTNAVWADDLVQETLVRAWANLDQFEPGTSLKAWLFTIMRNTFYTEWRRSRREVQDSDGAFASNLTTPPEQSGHLDFEDLKKALARLLPEQREALLLITVHGLSQEDAARICGCPVGTIKSRVSRARRHLAHLMQMKNADDLGEDGLLKAALQTPSQPDAP